MSLAKRFSAASLTDASARLVKGLNVRRFIPIAAAVGVWVSLEFTWWSIFRLFFIPKLTSFKPEDQGKHITEVRHTLWPAGLTRCIMIARALGQLDCQVV